MDEERKIREQIAVIDIQHRELDERISVAVNFNMLELQRLKKQKLMLKDAKARLMAQLLPDIIA